MSLPCVAKLSIPCAATPTAALVAALLIAPVVTPGQAHAALIITPAGPGLVATTNDNSNFTTSAEIQALVGTTTTLDLLYKQEQGGGESGTFASSYSTTFSNTPTDPQEATITYVLGQPVINTAEVYLIVKDGSATPAQYAFDLIAAGWNGTETIELKDFWPQQGAISNVAIWGGGGDRPPESPDIAPEPLSLAVWGGLGGFGLLFGIRRRRLLPA